MNTEHEMNHESDTYALTVEEQSAMLSPDDRRRSTVGWLGGAWAEAEAALPEGWAFDGVIRVYGKHRSSPPWEATASAQAPRGWEGIGPEPQRVSLTAFGDTSVEALKGLTKALGMRCERCGGVGHERCYVKLKGVR